MSAPKVDVLAVIDYQLKVHGCGTIEANRELSEARAAVAELIEAANFVLEFDGKKLGSIGEASLRAAVARVGVQP